jgi:FGGY-family pentulose kinase
MADHVIGVDVGTRSARAGVFDLSGTLLGRCVHEIALFQPLPDHAEHDSEDIWRAVCAAVRGACAQAGVDGDTVRAIGFDATCSLVIRDRNDEPLSVAADGAPNRDTIVWMDHRATAEADTCTATGHTVLDFIGGVMSPEMQIPKLMWLKHHLPEQWQRIGHMFDLADFLTWRATGNTARSQCTLVCKWTYLAHAQPGWRTDFLKTVGLDDLIARGNLPDTPLPVGSNIATLSDTAAFDLGLTTACSVTAGLIDAHAGALALLGPQAGDGADMDKHVALIAGTSTCVMGTSASPRLVPGVWGPYFGAVLPDLWLNEGGQSASGALLDHIVASHSAGGEPTPETLAVIIARIKTLRMQEGQDFAHRLHVLPDFHGNRSPLADAEAVGVISGLTLDASFDSLCRLYWRTAVAIALGIRHIIEALNAQGYAITTLHLAGGHTNNPLLIELYADATGCTVMESTSPDAILLGAAMSAAAASGCHPDLPSAARMMAGETRAHLPNPTRSYDRDFQVFLAMHDHRREIDAMLSKATK